MASINCRITLARALAGLPYNSAFPTDTTWSPQEKALYSLRDALQRYEFFPDYLAAIVRDQLRLNCTGKNVFTILRSNATTDQIRHLMFTISTRGRTATRKMTQETGHKTHTPTPNHTPLK